MRSHPPFAPKTRWIQAPSLAKVKRSLLLFYAIGAVGLLIPSVRSYYHVLTPLALLLGIGVLLIYHGRWRTKECLAGLLIVALGFLVEAIAVHTGFPFGRYSYGDSLGPKWLGVPFLIGINWFYLAYVSVSIAGRWVRYALPAWVLAPTLMLGYDLLLERAAPVMDMWHWAGERVPFQNYLAWWMLGLICTGVIRWTGMRTRNPMALLMFLCPFLFLLVCALSHS
jgi:putative membrane protein